MNTDTRNPAIRQIHATATRIRDEHVPDAVLVAQFVDAQNPDAFETLIHRHGPMLQEVCRRAVADANTADDVFQATFLMFARQASRIRNRHAVASWLHGTAIRLAHRALAQRTRTTRPDTRSRQPPADPLDELTGRELLRILDEELAELPERYRLPLVLCHLEGRTRDEAASHLGWSPGRVKGLLERGRQLLRDRLVRRGVSLSAALAVTMIGESIPMTAVADTLARGLARSAVDYALGLRIESGFVPHRAIELTEDALRTMFMTRLKVTLAVTATLMLAGVGTGLWISTDTHAADQPPSPRPVEPPPIAEKAEDADERLRNAEAQVRGNLRQIALAMHNYADAMGGRFPPSAQSSATGTPLLSWRVLLLPYLDEMELYQQFKLNEPWDSPHNKKLIGRMPDVYRIPAIQGRDVTETFFQVIVGHRSIFEEPGREMAGRTGRAGMMSGDSFGDEGYGGEGGGPGLSPSRGGFGGPGSGDVPGMGRSIRNVGSPILSVTDGTSNTLLVVEGESAVEWTKPADIPYSAAGRVPRLGSIFPRVFHAAFADGSVYALDKSIDEKTLRLLITRDDGHPVDTEAIKDPIFTTDPDQLRQENRELENEINRHQKQLAELTIQLQQRKRQIGPDGQERSPVDVLRLEQQELKRQANTLRGRLHSIQEELRQLEKPRK